MGEDGCNECLCDDGEWYCTRRACEPPPRCRPGDRRMAPDGCNTCHCDDSGRWACTEKACPDRCERGATRPAGDGCNTCSCVDGQWACTDMACDACEPGERRRFGCQVCVCDESGLFVCDTSVCPPPHCETDADCVVSGCSAEICAPEPHVSGCVALPEFQCYAEASCGCNQGYCAWGPFEQVDACLADFRD